jgi:hypothetical protein
MSEAHRYLDSAVWGKIYAQAWLDPAFHEQLETDPTAAVRAFCRDHGISLEGVRIVRITSRPGDLTDTQLTDVVKGGPGIYVLPIADFSC